MYIERDKSKYYDKAFDLLMRLEGIYSNDPADSGGATIYGIASKYHPEAFQKVYSLYTQGDTQGALKAAKEFYKELFWDRSHADIFEDFPNSYIVFDLAVNSHPRTAIKMMQHMANDFIDAGLVIDGKWGTHTEEAIRNALLAAEERDIFDYFVQWRLRFYTGIKSKRKFLPGWVNRIARIIKYILPLE